MEVIVTGIMSILLTAIGILFTIRYSSKYHINLIPKNIRDRISDYINGNKEKI